MARNDKTVRDYILPGLNLGDNTKKNLEKGTPRADERILSDAEEVQRRARLAAPALMDLIEGRKDADKALRTAERNARSLQTRVTRLTGDLGTVSGENRVYSTENRRLIGEHARVVVDNGNLRGDVGILTGENRVYNTQNGLLRGERNTAQAEQLRLTGENGRLAGENGAVTAESSRTRTCAYISTAAAVILALTTGIFYGSRNSEPTAAPTPVVRSVDETVKPVVEHNEDKSAYTIETLTDGSKRLKISKESLGRMEDVYFAIPEGGKDTLVDYISKAQTHASKSGKIGTRVHFYAPELEETLKALYSKDAISDYGAKGKLVKQDIELAAKEMGE